MAMTWSSLLAAQLLSRPTPCNWTSRWTMTTLARTLFAKRPWATSLTKCNQLRATNPAYLNGSTGTVNEVIGLQYSPLSKVNMSTYCTASTTLARHGYRHSLDNHCRCFTAKAGGGSGGSRRDSKGNRKGGMALKHASSLTDEEAAEVINVEALRTQLDKSLDRLRNDFVNTLTIRTSVGSIELLTVSFDGQKYALNELAQIIRKNPGLAIINMAGQPTAIPSVLEAIAKSGMNLNPRQEGTTISVPLPRVTREHREKLAKNAKSLFVRTKDEMKETQNKFIKNAKDKKGQMSDDLIFSVQQHVTALTDQRISDAQTMLQKKQDELIGG